MKEKSTPEDPHCADKPGIEDPRLLVLFSPFEKTLSLNISIFKIDSGKEVKKFVLL